MQYTLIDLHYKALLPLTFSRPVSHLLIGMDRVIDKWEEHLGQKPGICTAAHLSDVYPCSEVAEGIYINASLIPTNELKLAIEQLPLGAILAFKGLLLAAHCTAEQAEALSTAVNKMSEPSTVSLFEERKVYPTAPILLECPADIFSCNAAVMAMDFKRIAKNRRTLSFPKGVQTIGEHIFIEEGARLRPCILNAEQGPIYISADAEVMEGSLVRGPFFLGASSVLKMGAKIYGASTVGAHCKVGGEVTNSVIHDYSNKGHDGFLGNSVIGSWCNLGADTNTSNLKNNYSQVRVWDYESKQLINSGRQFIGLVMGDHSKAGINTMFNTGTVVGMCCNVYGGGFPKKFIPSFSWGSAEGFIDFDLERAYDMATAMKSRRGEVFTQSEKKIFHFVYEMEAEHRA